MEKAAVKGLLGNVLELHLPVCQPLEWGDIVGDGSEGLGRGDVFGEEAHFVDVEVLTPEMDDFVISVTDGSHF